MVAGGISLDLTPMSNPTTPAVARPASVNPFEINRRVLASDLTPAAKAVLLVILDHARHGVSRCTAGTRTIAREAHVTDRTVRTALPVLAGRGLIRIDRATGSPLSRHVITLGPCIHQGGNPFPLRLHEGGNDFPPGRKSVPHEGGNGFPQRSPVRDEEKDAVPPTDRPAIDGPAEWDRGLDPRWARLFPGRPVLSP